MTTSQRIVWGGALASLLTTVSTAHADPLKSMAKQLAKGIQKTQTKRVAVLLFPYQDGGLSSGSSIVSDRLMTLLASHKGVQMIERSRLANLLQEMRLEESGATSAEDAQKPGRILAADAVITGTLVDHEEEDTEVYARLIRTETGEVLAAASTHIERTWEDPPSLPPDMTASAEEPEYVMHASALIPTPWARGGYGMRTPPTQIAWASNEPAAETIQAAPAAASYQPAPQTAGQMVIVGQAPAPAKAVAAPGAAVYHPRPYSTERAQLLYALGATLDYQGQSRQATKVYQHLIQNYPDQPLVQKQAQRRLAAERSSRSSY